MMSSQSVISFNGMISSQSAKRPVSMSKDDRDPKPHCNALEVKRGLSEGTVFVNDGPSAWFQIAQVRNRQVLKKQSAQSQGKKIGETRTKRNQTSSDYFRINLTRT